MNKYSLKSGDEVLNTVRKSSLELAIEFFAEVKNLQKEDLLNIFTVSICK